MRTDKAPADSVAFGYAGGGDAGRGRVEYRSFRWFEFTQSVRNGLFRERNRISDSKTMKKTLYNTKIGYLMPKRARCPSCGRLFGRDMLDDHVQRCRRRNHRRNTNSRKSSRRKLILDGNNIAFFMSPNGVPLASNLVRAYRSLQSAGYRATIVVSAALKYKVDKPDVLRSLINRGVVVESSRGTNDDLTIIRLARDRNANIVSNDRFLDWRDQYPGLAGRLIRYRMTPAGLILQ